MSASFLEHFWGGQLHEGGAGTQPTRQHAFALVPTSQPCPLISKAGLPEPSADCWRLLVLLVFAEVPAATCCSCLKLLLCWLPLSVCDNDLLSAGSLPAGAADV
jgi:hypothetical protein